MKSKELKTISRGEALIYAKRMLKVLDPHVEQLTICGELRRDLKDISAIDIVVIPKIQVIEKQNLFEFEEDYINETAIIVKDEYGDRVKTNGERLQTVIFNSSIGDFRVHIHHTTQTDFGRMVFLHTGSSVFTLKMGVGKYRKIGWESTINGLRLRNQCVKKGTKYILNPNLKEQEIYPPVFTTEEDFFEFVGVEYYEASNRNWL